MKNLFFTIVFVCTTYFSFGQTSELLPLDSAVKRKKSTVLLEMNTKLYPKVTHHEKQKWGEEILELEEDPFFKDYVGKADKKYILENGMRILHLDEVVVRGNRRFRDNDDPQLHYSQLSRVINSEEITQGGGDIISLIRRLGIRVQTGVQDPNSGEIYDIMFIRGGGRAVNGEIRDWCRLPQEWYDINIFDLEAIGISDRGGYPIFIMKPFEERMKKSRYNIATVAPLGYQTPAEFYSPQYDTPNSRNNSTPDLRSTIYWQPNVVADENGKASLSFYTADSQSSYSVVIEGITSDGKLIYQCKQNIIEVE